MGVVALCTVCFLVGSSLAEVIGDESRAFIGDYWVFTHRLTITFLSSSIWALRSWFSLRTAAWSGALACWVALTGFMVFV